MRNVWHFIAKSAFSENRPLLLKGWKSSRDAKKSFFKKENFSQSKSKKSEIKFHNFGKGSLNFSKKEVHAATSEVKIYFALTNN